MRRKTCPDCCFLMAVVLGATVFASQQLTFCQSFVIPNSQQQRRHHHQQTLFSKSPKTSEGEHNDEAIYCETSRRSVLSKLTQCSLFFTAAATTFGGSSAAVAATVNNKEEDGSMYSPKFVQQYDDFSPTSEGWSYRDVSPGKSDQPAAELGDRVVYDWSGYTIGYFGRPFQAKGGPQGGAFDKDIDYSRTVLGSGMVVKGLECAFVGMRPGQVRQVVVPYEANMTYPADDPSHDRVGPKPTTFSGERALNFVLENPRIDRTLLFNIKVIRIDKPNGKGGFVRG